MELDEPAEVVVVAATVAVGAETVELSGAVVVVLSLVIWGVGAGWLCPWRTPR